MNALKGIIQGELLVACSTTPGKYILPKILARFHHKYPKVRVTCHVFPQSHSMEALNSGEVHFALASVPYDKHPHVEFKSFMTDPVILIAPHDHPWAKTGVISPEELIEGTFIRREDGSGTQTAVISNLNKRGIEAAELRTILTLGNSEAIALAVQEGLGVGFVSRMVYTRLVKDKVVPIQIEGMEIAREIMIGRHTRRPCTASQNAFWEFVNCEENLYAENEAHLPV